VAETEDTEGDSSAHLVGLADFDGVGRATARAGDGEGLGLLGL